MQFKLSSGIQNQLYLYTLFQREYLFQANPDRGTSSGVDWENFSKLMLSNFCPKKGGLILCNHYQVENHKLVLSPQKQAIPMFLTISIKDDEWSVESFNPLFKTEDEALDWLKIYNLDTKHTG